METAPFPRSLPRSLSAPAPQGSWPDAEQCYRAAAALSPPDGPERGQALYCVATALHSQVREAGGGGGWKYQPKLNRTQCKRARGESVCICVCIGGGTVYKFKGGSALHECDFYHAVVIGRLLLPLPLSPYPYGPTPTPDWASGLGHISPPPPPTAPPDQGKLLEAADAYAAADALWRGQAVVAFGRANALAAAGRAAEALAAVEEAQARDAGTPGRPFAAVLTRLREQLAGAVGGSGSGSGSGGGEGQGDDGSGGPKSG